MPNLTAAIDFRLDAVGFYVLEEQAIKGKTHSGGTLQLDNAMKGKAGSIALDAGFVYWSDKKLSTVNRAARK